MLLFLADEQNIYMKCMLFMCCESYVLCVVAPCRFVSIPCSLWHWGPGCSEEWSGIWTAVSQSMQPTSVSGLWQCNPRCWHDTVMYCYTRILCMIVKMCVCVCVVLCKQKNIVRGNSSHCKYILHSMCCSAATTWCWSAGRCLQMRDHSLLSCASLWRTFSATCTPT